MGSSIQLSKFRPLLERVLVEKLGPPLHSTGGVLLPESSKKINAGKVVAVGSGHRTDDGDIIPMSVKVGDKVILPAAGGVDVNFGDKMYYLYREDQFLGILQ